MKKIYLLLTIIFVVAAATSLQAQITDDIYYDGQPINQPVKKNVTKKYMGFNEIAVDTAAVSAYELHYMRYCLGRYHKERNAAYWLVGGSMALSFAAMQFEGEPQYALLVMGGISGISSVVVFVAAERWLKRSAIKPSPNGLGVVIEF